ncbi:MAG: glycoside hydrolase family 18 [Alistipes finegoldii]
MLRDNAYYQNLRAYKQTKHKLAFGWYGSWTAVGASYQSRSISAPDSMDIISIWSQWHTLTPQQMADKEFVQKTLGTKVTYTIFSDKLPEPFLEIGNGEYTDEAIEAYAKPIAKTRWTSISTTASISTMSRAMVHQGLLSDMTMLCLPS